MFAVIHIANFSLQAALRHDPEARRQAVALLDAGQSKPLIVECTRAARAAGVAADLTASQALARCPSLKIATRSAAQEDSATEILLQTAYAFSPNLEATGPGICTVELKGLGLAKPAAVQAWSEKILEALATLGLEGNIGIGPTPDLALLAAQGAGAAADSKAAVPASPQLEFPESAGLAPGEPPAGDRVAWAEKDFVADLPVAALAPPADMADVLARWGVRTVGEFLALGKTAVAERLGAAALALFERVSPTAVRPLKLVSPPDQFAEEMEFENEIETTEPLLLWLRKFVDELSRRLDAIYLVVAQLRLSMGLASGAKYERVFKIPSPTGDRGTLYRMLQTHLETLRTDSPIVSLRLAATPAPPEMHQFGLFQNTLRNPNQFAETFTRLAALVGPENVGTPVREPSHRPDAFRLEPPNFEFVPAREVQAGSAEGLQFRRFRPPLPAQFEFCKDQPARLASRMFAGKIAAARGPFLSSGNWWDDSRWAREEWDVELADGPLLRLFRSPDGCFVEGVYD
jgi:protein ImuB